jgi:hypothetical protein
MIIAAIALFQNSNDDDYAHLQLMGRLAGISEKYEDHTSTLCVLRTMQLL